MTHSLRSLSPLFLPLLLGLAACAANSAPAPDPTPLVVDTDAGPRSVGVRCGPVTCDEGLVCCNSACGLCTAPGWGCIALGCAPDAGAVEPADDCRNHGCVWPPLCMNVEGAWTCRP